MYGEKLPRKLKEAKYAIEQLMVDYFDLWPFIECPNGSRSEVIFEIVNWGQMSEIAAFGGFPTRYPHWRFGMEYNELSKGYAYGLQKIYEMVINNNPPFAYLLEANKMVDQKIVMPHVYAHCDFFFNNRFFKKSDRNAGKHNPQTNADDNRPQPLLEFIAKRSHTRSNQASASDIDCFSMADDRKLIFLSYHVQSFAGYAGQVNIASSFGDIDYGSERLIM